MKFKVQAQIGVLIEKDVEAPSLEDALAQARKMKVGDFIYMNGSQWFTDTVRIKIVGATEPKVTR